MSTEAHQDGPVSTRGNLLGWTWECQGTLLGWTLPLECCSGDSSSLRSLRVSGASVLCIVKQRHCSPSLFILVWLLGTGPAGSLQTQLPH